MVDTIKSIDIRLKQYPFSQLENPELPETQQYIRNYKFGLKRK